jgi:hypothetical protein
MTPAVGRAFAFGDFGTDDAARESLTQLANKYAATDTGAAAALTLANAHGRDLRDLYSGDLLRQTDQAAAESRFKSVAEDALNDDPTKLVMLATAVAAPTEANAPVLEMAADHLSQPAAATPTLGEAADGAPPPQPTASAAATSRKASALRLLRNIRRTYTARE